MLELVVGLLAAVVAVLPDLLKVLDARRARTQQVTDALIQRDLDVLHGPPTDEL